MAKAKKKNKSVSTKKATLRKQIIETLETTFADIKISVGKKKFERKIEKASKVLASGIKKIDIPKPPKEKKETKKKN